MHIKKEEFINRKPTFFYSDVFFCSFKITSQNTNTDFNICIYYYLRIKNIV